MMRSSGIEGTPRHEQGAQPPRPRPDFDDRIAALSRRLARLPVERADEAIREAVETLLQALSALHVSFLDLSGPTDAQALRAATGVPGRSAGYGIDLPENMATLRRGATVELGSRSRSETDLSTGGGGSGWCVVGRSWLVPCIGSSGLLGAFQIDLGMRPARGATTRLERAGRVGDLLASFLERRRLARALETSHAQQLHDERMETLGVVASSVAHDFNNVLTAILGYAELLGLELPAGAPGRSELAEIEGAAIRATRLVDQVLAFGRRRPAGVERLDLAETIRGLSPMIERVLGERVRLELDLEDGAPPIRVDPTRLEQLLLNLASNARDAVTESGRGRGCFSLASRIVEIDTDGRDRSRTGEGGNMAGDGNAGKGGETGDGGGAAARVLPLVPGPHLRLSARDDGCGIDPATRDRIFEPFFTTKTESVGTGLGLATAAAVLREAGGMIDVESELGVGSSFHFYFPLTPASPTSERPGA